MKPILAIIGGFALSFGMFIAGIMFALFVMVDEPPGTPTIADANMAEVWSSEPRTVNTQAQAFERLPANPPRADGRAQGASVLAGEAQAAEGAGAAQPAVDTMTTAAVPPDDEEPSNDEAVVQEPPANDRAAARLLASHAEWCSRRYRSYDAGSNSYSPFNGGRRPCMSPYWAQYAALTGAPTPESNQRFVPLAEEPAPEESIAAEDNGAFDAVAEEPVDETGLVIDDRHVRDCFSRYRSYRPEDNTYQPFDGGPRRQCE